MRGRFTFIIKPLSVSKVGNRVMMRVSVGLSFNRILELMVVIFLLVGGDEEME